MGSVCGCHQSLNYMPAIIASKTEIDKYFKPHSYLPCHHWQAQATQNDWYWAGFAYRTSDSPAQSQHKYGRNYGSREILLRVGMTPKSKLRWG